MTQHDPVVGIAALALAGCQNSAGGEAGGASRDQIRAVGSSTVYPFTTAVAEQFARKNAGFKAPIVESTGTGAGMKLFCAGVGAQFPDIENASRRIKKSEVEDCAKQRREARSSRSRSASTASPWPRARPGRRCS